MKLTVKAKNRSVLKDMGIDEVGNHKTMVLKATNTSLADFDDPDER